MQREWLQFHGKSFAVRETGEKPLEGLKAKIRGQTNTADFVAAICYRLLPVDQEGQVEGSLLSTSGSQALGLMGSFNHSDIW